MVSFDWGIYIVFGYHFGIQILDNKTNKVWNLSASCRQSDDLQLMKSNPKILAGEDEKDCNFKPCESNQFQCGSRECIEKSKVCNGLIDCISKDDELECEQFECDPRTEFKCDSGQCIDLRKRNDFFIDCPDASDEKDTGEFLGVVFLKCMFNLKISVSCCTTCFACLSMAGNSELNPLLKVLWL